MIIQTSIQNKLVAKFHPKHIAVENESHKHNVPPDSETHFKVVMVSDEFEGKRPVKRHQDVYAVLATELQAQVHALALHLYTAEEWSVTSDAPDSPDCLGGS